jgi:hypothetical protein
VPRNPSKDPSLPPHWSAAEWLISLLDDTPISC